MSITRLPPAYRKALADLTLAKGPLPLMVTEAVRLYGTVELPGSKNNQVILSWAEELGIDNVYSNDSIPWCGLYAAIAAKRANKLVPASPLWALSWKGFGVEVKKGATVLLGDVLVLTRKTSSGAVAGHVAVILGEDATHYHVIGGNQSDAVTITRIPKTRTHWVRRPAYKVQPATAVNLKFKPEDAKAGGSEA